MNGEMNTLRNKRIDLLKGMQGIRTNNCKSVSLLHNDGMILLLFLLMLNLCECVFSALVSHR